jgi:hypothetical protein
MVYMLRGVEIEREDVRDYKSKGKEKEGKEEAGGGKERRVGHEMDQIPFNSNIYPIHSKRVIGDKSSPVQYSPDFDEGVTA